MCPDSPDLRQFGAKFVAKVAPAAIEGGRSGEALGAAPAKGEDRVRAAVDESSARAMLRYSPLRAAAGVLSRDSSSRTRSLRQRMCEELLCPPPPLPRRVGDDGLDTFGITAFFRSSRTRSASRARRPGATGQRQCLWLATYSAHDDCNSSTLHNMLIYAHIIMFRKRYRSR